MAHIFIGNFSLYEIAVYFFVYAFFGWCAEVIYAALKTGKFVNRGFLNGPVCPIYGAGVVLVLLALTPVSDNFLLLFLCGALLCSALEFATGFVLEKLFHRKWWDYSDKHFNLLGYICLSMSLIWGIACLLVVDVLHPAIASLIGKLPLTAGYVLLGIAAAGFAVDLVFTVLQITKLGRRIRELKDINRALRLGSDTLGKAIAGVTIAGSDAVGKLREKSNEFSEKMRQKRIEHALRLRADRAALAEKIRKSRLGRAFPALGQDKKERHGDLPETPNTENGTDEQ